MALTYELKHISEHETLCWKLCEKDNPMTGQEAGKKYMRPVTEALVFATMAIGINTITEKNAEEFFKRVSFFEQVHSPWLHTIDESGKRVPRLLTLDDVRQHIGLRTNASKRTDVQFAALMFRNFKP